MLMYVLSIVIVVVSNVIYHITQKMTPSGVSPFAALFVTYITAAVLSLISLLLFKTDGKGLIDSFHGINYTSIILGFAVVGLEFGYLAAYRAGWNLSIGSLVANILLAVILIPIGIIFFKEGFSVSKAIGALLCIAGLFLINK